MTWLSVDFDWGVVTKLFQAIRDRRWKPWPVCEHMRQTRAAHSTSWWLVFTFSNISWICICRLWKFLNCWNYKSESFPSLIELEGLECLKIKTSILTSQDLALRPRQILPLENAMRVSAPQVKINSIFNLLTQDLIISITQASVFQAALPVTRLMIVTGILIFLSLLLGQMIISFPPLSFHR